MAHSNVCRNRVATAIAGTQQGATRAKAVREREDEFLAKHVEQTAEMQEGASNVLAGASGHLPSGSGGDVVATAGDTPSCGGASSSTRPADFSMTSEQDPKRKREVDDEGDQDIDLSLDHSSAIVKLDEAMDSGSMVLSVCESLVCGDTDYEQEECA